MARDSVVKRLMWDRKVAQGSLKWLPEKLLTNGSFRLQNAARKKNDCILNFCCPTPQKKKRNSNIGKIRMVSWEGDERADWF